jgi:ribosomal protein S27AE
MEKYSVKQQLTKQAKTLGFNNCPACGTTMGRIGRRMWCSKCGTEPWEPPAPSDKTPDPPIEDT